jgi:hypothetical protein
MTKVNKYYSAGYLIIKPLNRSEWMNKDILPRKIISASSCLCDSYPHAWSFSGSWKPHESVFTFTTIGLGEKLPSQKEYIKDKMEELNLNSKSFKMLQKWVEKKYKNKQLEYPNLFLNLDTAREFYKKFLTHMSDLELIGIGFSKEIIDKYIWDEKHDQMVQEAIRKLRLEHPDIIAIAEERYGKYMPDENKFKMKEDSFTRILSRYEPVDPNGMKLGFEILGFEGPCNFHSHICNSLEKDLKKEIGVRFNENGFIDSLEDAIRSTKYIEDGELGEPVPWYPCVIMRYEI